MTVSYLLSAHLSEKFELLCCIVVSLITALPVGSFY